MAPKKEKQTDPMAAANERGYIGTVPDKTPNSEYALGGAISSGDKPDPAYEEIAEDMQNAEDNLPTE